MYRLKPLLLAAISLGACSNRTVLPEADLVATGGALIDGTGAALREDVDIFVHDGVIVGVLPSGIASVLAAGAGGVVHAVTDMPLPDSATAVAMYERGFFYVPTSSLFDSFTGYLEDSARLDDQFLRATVSSEELAAAKPAGLLDTSSVVDRASSPRS